MAQNIAFAIIVTVPVIVVIWSVVSNVIEEQRSYRNSLKGRN